MMRSIKGCLAAALVLFLQPVSVEARVDAVVDLSSQTVDVFVNGQHHHRWATSTGRRGHRTPTGSYRPQRLERQWYSRKYDWTPMPYSVFFRGGYAIHGTTETGKLGRPASRGCIRLRTANARVLFELIKRHGMSRSRVVIRR